MIGIICAMEVEVTRLVRNIENASHRVISTMDFWSGEIYGKPVVVGKSGVGKVSAAICANVMIMLYNVEVIINSGVAGGLRKGLLQCDLVVADAFVQHDVDTTGLGDPKGFISTLELVSMPTTKSYSDMLENVSVKQSERKYEIYRGTVATGDQFVSSVERSAYITGNFGAIACDMEGGAIAQVCIMAGIDYAAIRCISDNADGSAGLSYNAFAPVAASRVSQIVLEFIRGLN